jgi:hypothetical protein
MTEITPRRPFLFVRRYLLMALIALLIAAGFTATLRTPSVAADSAIIVDNTSATTAGSWTASTYQANYYGANYPKRSRKPRVFRPGMNGPTF